MNAFEVAHVMCEYEMDAIWIKYVILCRFIVCRLKRTLVYITDSIGLVRL